MTPSQGEPSVASAARPHAEAGGPMLPRQFVNFAFFKLDSSFRRLTAIEKRKAHDEFLDLFKSQREGLICLTYSTIGLRAEADFLLWRISYAPDEIQSQSAAINKTTLGAYLSTPHSFLSMTKPSVYVDKIDPSHTSESRSRIVPGWRRFLFVYPFVKTREWYLLPQEKRQEIMDVHIKVGNEFPSVKLNTTYSFGLDDQEFVVAFETDQPRDFLDLVMKLRETQSSKYTLRDTPIFTCVQMPMERILDQMF